LKNIFFAERNIAKNGSQIHRYFGEAHESKLAVMLYNFSPCALHPVTAPATKDSIGILPLQFFHQIGTVHIARCFACNDIIPH